MTESQLNEDDVIAYLENNPDFLSRNPDLLETLTPPQLDKGQGVVDFQHFMLTRLKTDKDRAVKDKRVMIESARANMSILNQVQTAVIRLLDAQSLEELIETIAEELPLILHVDIVTIIIEAEDSAIPHAHTPGVRLAEEGVTKILLQGKNSHLQANITNPAYVQDVFGKPVAQLIKSLAMMRLDISPAAPQGLIAFGSRDPAVFQDGQGTELIGFLADVTARVIRRWLDLPA